MSFAEYLRTGGKAALTVIEYERRLRLWRAFLISKNMEMRKIARTDVLEYRDLLLKNKQSTRTVNAKLSTISQYYDYLVVIGEIDENPVPRGLHVRGKHPRIKRLSDEELHAILCWFDTLQPNLRAAWYALYGSGARIGEITKLKHSDIKVSGGAVYVDIKDAKWGSDRLVPIVNQKAAKVVYDYWAAEKISDKPLFHISKRTLQSYATAFSEETGIHFWGHLLRHTFAARLLEQGVRMTEIQYLLGHKTLSMTAHYTESALLDVTHLAPTVFQERGSGGDAPTATGLLLGPKAQ
ncbi:tyrosine-type recombinase/integrase [Lacticaseibacillus paracasei]|uniref:tyrosine-type recombinase/integrase n=1 Tax=Lacticaseibacillus paracasei TaxID=1597 RepID=UPI000CD1907E|nr:tyrosine-type recombinase/integrase [Lacticaseibacillus paracasei]